jgi:peptide/nickel transport system substrate-binding protein
VLQRIRTATLFLAVLAATTLTGCRSREHAQLPPAPVSSTPEDGGTVVRRLDSDVATLNPIFVSTAYEKQVLSYLFDALVEIDQEANVAPGAARAWKISPDGKTYTFELDPNSTFSDGTPVTASDVLFTLDKIHTDSAQLSGALEGIDPEKTIALDPSTVQVTFKEVHAGQLLAFNFAILPRHVYEKGDFKKDHTWTVVGNGPYVLQKRTAGQEILLSRRSDYKGQKPYLQYVLFKVISEPAVALNALKRDDIDEMEMSTEQWRQSSADKALTERVDLRRYYRLGYSFIPWNTRDPLLSDPRVRRALAACLDRKSIINHIYYGTARVITGPFTPDQWAYSPSVAPIEFDPDAARRKLVSLGWLDTDHDGILDHNGRKFEFEMLIPVAGKATADQAQVFQDGLKRAGVKLDLVPLDNTQFITRVSEGKFQSAILAWDLDLDPDVFSTFHSSQVPPHGQNFVWYSNPEIDQLIVKGRETLDQKQRTDIYHRIHEILAADQPYTWIVQESTKWGINRRVQNVTEGRALGPFYWDPGPRNWWIPVAQRVHPDPH